MNDGTRNEVTEIDLVELGKIAFESKWMIFGFGIIVATILFASSFYFRPRFRADVLLLNSPAERRGGDVLSSLGGAGSGLAALAGISPNADSNTQEALAVLKSRSLIDDFIADQNLLPILFKDRWDTANNHWKSESSLFYSTFADKPTAGDAYELFNTRIRRVEEDRKSGLVTLSIEWSDPQLAADWATALVSRANSQLRNTTIERAEKSLAFLNEQTKKSGEVEVRQAIYKLVDSELKREMFAKVNEDYAFKVIDPAKVPEKKVSPKRMFFAAFGFAVGASIAFAMALRRRRD